MFFLSSFHGLEETGPSFSFYWKHSKGSNGTAKSRHIGRPNESMKAVHRALREELAPHLDNLWPCVVGARKEHSVLSGIHQHAGNPYLYSLDIHRAYEHVDIPRLALHMSRLESNWEGRAAILDFLTKYCADPVQGGLITGAPASPDLFNLYAFFEIDAPILSLISLWLPNAVYTRYFDDITVSSSCPLPRAELEREIRVLLKQKGFRRSAGKSAWHDLTKSTAVINGVGLRANGETFLSRPYLKQLRFELDRWDGSEEAKYRLAGKLAWFYQVTNRPYEQMNRTEQELVNASRILSSIRIHRK
jgi:hypothetical protein